MNTTIWYVGRLTPAALEIFTDGFYPAPKRGTGNQEVFFTEVSVTPSHKKVILAPDLKSHGYIRIVTQQLGMGMLQGALRKATRAEMVLLDANVEKAGLKL